MKTKTGIVLMGIVLLASALLESGCFVRMLIPSPKRSFTANDLLVSKDELPLDSIRVLYNLPSVTVVQEPTPTEIGGYRTINAIIKVPTMALSKDAVENQVGVQSPEVFQTIAMFVMEDHQHNLAMAYIYKGNNEVFNAQAQEIVDSIRITCAAKP